eukprot:TRINITY_DN4285_c0_g1_i1.p1 TRINITY_DN4285_c0_g1~~TRINITY_DN4285_c0_g1_i1.p1  ORF type:complete len:663 (+),score=186.57 TRINITY_DN4285_c0_g1_i1:97-2085(+)
MSEMDRIFEDGRDDNATDEFDRVKISFQALHNNLEEMRMSCSEIQQIVTQDSPPKENVQKRHKAIDLLHEICSSREVLEMLQPNLRNSLEEFFDEELEINSIESSDFENCDKEHNLFLSDEERDEDEFKNNHDNNRHSLDDDEDDLNLQSEDDEDDVGISSERVNLSGDDMEDEPHHHHKHHHLVEDSELDHNKHDDELDEDSTIGGFVDIPFDGTDDVGYVQSSISLEELRMLHLEARKERHDLWAKLGLTVKKRSKSNKREVEGEDDTFSTDDSQEEHENNNKHRDNDNENSETEEEYVESESEEELPPVELGDFDLKVIFDKNKTGFEESKDLRVKRDDVLAGRYLVRAVIGEAAFSIALRCVDLKNEEQVCLKVIKNSKDFFDQSIDEIKLLLMMQQNGEPSEHHVLQMFDFFYHREHLCIVTELLKDNLYEFSKYCREMDLPNYFNEARLQRVASDCLKALQFIHSLDLIHCDLKPENILIESYSRCRVKVIDFGSSCFTTDHLTSYIQSRSYRAPEVILGCKYGTKIDLWSLGCILAELFTGDVLFHNESVQTMLARITAILGPYPERMMATGRQVNELFTANRVIYEKEENDVLLYLPKRTSMKEMMRGASPLFLDLVESLLSLDPNQRPTATEALEHPFFKDQMKVEPFALPDE